MHRRMLRSGSKWDSLGVDMSTGLQAIHLHPWIFGLWIPSKPCRRSHSSIDHHSGLTIGEPDAPIQNTNIASVHPSRRIASASPTSGFQCGVVWRASFLGRLKWFYYWRYEQRPATRTRLSIQSERLQSMKEPIVRLHRTPFLVIPTRSSGSLVHGKDHFTNSQCVDSGAV